MAEERSDGNTVAAAPRTAMEALDRSNKRAREGAKDELDLWRKDQAGEQGG